MALHARRGEIWLVDLGLVQKTRPVLILSVDFLDHEREVVTYVPRTTAQRGTRLEVAHQARGFEPGVFDAQGLGSIPTAKLVRSLGTAEAPTLRAVEDSVWSLALTR
jgi:mRNA interferase MazF